MVKCMIDILSHVVHRLFYERGRSDNTGQFSLNILSLFARLCGFENNFFSVLLSSVRFGIFSLRQLFVEGSVSNRFPLKQWNFSF